MRMVPRKHQQLAVAIPASFTLDIPHLREKTARVGLVARALAMFRVEELIVYLDQDNPNTRTEQKLIEKILNFQETPQYLRRHLFHMDPDLAYTGTLPPLRSPNHPDILEPAVGQLREAIATSTGQTSTVNAGFKQPVTVNTRLQPSQRVTIRITRAGRALEGEIVDPSRLTIYWTFRVSRGDTLGRIVKQDGRDLTISTSRQGKDVRKAMDELQTRWKTSRRPVIAFGSPKEGVPEILARSNMQVSSFDFNLNTLPNQGVETVRTEEALLGTLAALNLLEEE